MMFKRLKLENIRSYEKLDLQFPKGSVLLSGDIGAGKTSILLALQFALFGLQPGQKGTSILRQGTDKAYVSLELELDGQTVILERTIKQAKNGSITQDSNTITINNRVEEISTSEMKDRVIKLLDYPKEFVKKSNLLYKFTVYTPQEEMKEIIQEKPEVRLDTLRHIFGIDRYKRIKENSQILMQAIKDAVKIKEFETREINLLKERSTTESENQMQLKKQINNLLIEHNRVIGMKEQSELRLKQTEGLLNEKRKIDSEISNKKTELRGKNELKSRLEKEMVSMQNQIKQKIDFSQASLDNILKLLQKHKQLLDENNLKLMQTNAKISVLESKKENSLGLKDKIISLENCPTCLQSVNQDHKSRLSKKTQFDIDEIERELKPKLFEREQIRKDIETEKHLIQGYEQDKNLLEGNRIKSDHQKTIETKIKNDSFVLDRTLLEIKELETKTQELEEKTLSFKDSEKLCEIERQEFDKVALILRGLEINLAEKKKESEILARQLENLKQEIQKKENIRSQLNYLRELQDWFQEKFLSVITLTETNVLAKLRSEFSKIFNEWFLVLVSDSLSVKLDEDFTPIISNKDYEMDYDFLSGGERTAVALAYRLALNQILNSILSKIKTKDIVILDEPTDGFSEQQLDKMRDIFEQLKSEQIILVSHEQKIESFVDSIIRIKKDGTSSVETK